jgi:hypothetical protein
LVVPGEGGLGAGADFNIGFTSPLKKAVVKLSKDSVVMTGASLRCDE